MNIYKLNSDQRLFILFSIVTFLTLSSYSLFTQHIWEDFFITFKFSKNLCDGYGLVYEPGIRVHGFTSPLGVLLPALSHLMTGKKSYFYAIWLFRLLFCIPAFICGGIFLIKFFRDSHKKILYPAIFIAGIYLFESKSLVFSVNGMETAFMLMFLAATIYFIYNNFERNWLYIGISWAGLMWTRPDSFVYISAISISFILFSDISKTTIIKTILKAACVTTILYFPWFLWSWVYYGTPIPHTVTAKSAIYSSMQFSFFGNLFICIPKIFAPPYPIFSEWPAILKFFSYTSGIFCFSLWVFPLKDRFTRCLSFIFFLLTLYISSMPYAYPWYFPPVTMIGSIIIVKFITIINEHRLLPVKLIHLPKLLLGGFLSMIIIIFMMVSYQFKVQQKEIEIGTRMQIGKWLRTKIKKNDRIYLECLGYIGYFSGGKMLDYPGLSSPRVSKLLKKGYNFVTVIEPLEPEWIVVRPGEFKGLHQSEYFRKKYDLVKVYSSVKKIQSYKYLLGESLLLHDATFFIMKKRVNSIQSLIPKKD